MHKQQQSSTRVKSIQCLLCAQQTEFIGIGQCDHEPMCYRCIYKMRVISKNNSCPICKTQCKRIIILAPGSEHVSFAQSHTKKLLADKQYGDIFYLENEGQKAFEKLTEHKCFVKVNGKQCPSNNGMGKKFNSIAFLKRHLKEQHHRHLCDICCEKKTCVLEQQKLYTFNQLNKHLERGDIDEFGNIVFLHPYCAFCKAHFFDDDEFKRHINVEHITCNVCGPQERLRYYKNYESLETHFKMSHYICMEKDCLDSKFVAFKSADQLKIHRVQLHERNAQSNVKIDAKNLCGFQSQGYNGDKEILVIKDKEGVDMENQFLSLKKSKNRTLMEADRQKDQIFDIRSFFHSGLDQDQHWDKVLQSGLKNNGKSKGSNKYSKNRKDDKRDEQKQSIKAQEKPSEIVQNIDKEQQKAQCNKPKNKKKYVKKQDFPQKVAKTQALVSTTTQSTTSKKPHVKQDAVKIEDLLIVQSLNFTKLSNEQFDSKLRKLISDDDMKKFVDFRAKLFKKKIREDQFVSQFFHIMGRNGLKAGYNIFPHFIRTIIHQDVKFRLDQEYLLLIKKLPSNCSQSLLMKSYKYSNFFKQFLEEIEENIEYRINNNILSIKKQVKKNKQRLYQIMGVVRRLKIEEMAKLKFATNFGLKQDTIQFVQNKVFRKKIAEIQEQLDKIQNEEFLDLYIFVKYCLHAIKHADNMFLEKHKIHQNILQDFLYDRPYLEQKFGLKKNQLKTMEERVKFQEIEQEKKYKNQLRQMQKKNKSYGFETKADFNLVDKGDFPELATDNKAKEQEKREQTLKDMYNDSKVKPATYQKKINQLFPTLGQDEPNCHEFEKKHSNSSNSGQKTEKNESKKQKAWWEKINEKKKSNDQQEQVQVIRVKKGGKNKKQKWVSVKPDGLFGR